MISREENRILLLEPTSGISGDMFLGSLLDLGMDPDFLSRVIDDVLPEKTEVNVWSEKRTGITGTRFAVTSNEEAGARGLSEIISLVEASELPGEVIETSKSMFERLAEVESGIHGISPEEVHFHEIGALDSIADIVGSAAAIYRLDPEGVFSTQVNVGEGTVNTEHGELPVPAPATAELLRRRGIPTFSNGTRKELTTPTGALILSTFVDEFSRPPAELKDIGYGLGAKEVKGSGNFLRASLASIPESPDGIKKERAVVLETNIDDMNPELFPVVEERLMEAGALDVFKTPIQMKKNRPGVKLTVIGKPGGEDRLSEIILQETSTLGVRFHEVKRRKLKRKTHTVQTEYGEVLVKVGYLQGEPINYSPEFESCRNLAEETGLTTREVYRRALAKAEEGSTGN
ncbi:MAG: nickel pincer cofactor biosynthesis protein LarC [Candidatus Bipolaricaulota bacterium]